MLRVPVGFAGVVDIYKNGVLLRNFNVLTDYGKQYLRTPSTPSFAVYLYLGSGRQDDPSKVTELASFVLSSRVTNSLAKVVKQSENSCTYEVQYLTTIPKGRVWTLRELGLTDSVSSGYKLITYLHVRNSSGELSEIPVAAEDELRIIYRLQITVPLELPKVVIPIDGGSGGSVGVEFSHVPNDHISTLWWASSAGLCTGENLTGRRVSAPSGSTVRESSGNGTWKSWGNGKEDAGMGYTFNFDPPLTKTNTQTLRLTTIWDLHNVDAIEVS